MTEEEILQYNKMCAEFLNLHRDEEVAIYKFNAYPYDFLKFHSNWDWIMEVVEAIEKKGYEIDIFSNCVEICDTPDENYITEAVGKTKKEAVVQAINQFLIWYNENN
jgi:hypothetical protein